VGTVTTTEMRMARSTKTLRPSRNEDEKKVSVDPGMLMRPRPLIKLTLAGYDLSSENLDDI
jgi:hypothetical protein